MQAGQSLPVREDMLDLDPLQLETIELDSDQVERAIALGRSLPSAATTSQWQIYLNVLALFGFRLWLQERASLTIDWKNCSLYSACGGLDEESKIISGLHIGGFQVCLLVVGNVLEASLCLPKALLEQPDLRSHFYVLVEVQEELQRVTVQRFLPFNQLQSLQQDAPLREHSDGTYRLPLDWFTPHLEHLLLYLQCLQPAALPLQHPGQVRASAQVVPSEPLLQPTINVGLWLEGQLDHVAQHLKWHLLPVLAPSLRSLVRSPFAELKTILQDLEQQCELILPPQARSAYQDAQIADSYIRLYALTWPLLSEASVPEWTLLLILGAQPSTRLPQGIKLQVSDQSQVLVERELEGDPNNTYLYARVSGNWQEVFLVAITLKNGAMLTLPPFAFRVG